MGKQRHHTTARAPSNSTTHLQLQVAPHFSQTKVPLGWGIEVVPRADGSYSDRYYYEPETGRRFRSVREVERHLNGSPTAHQIDSAQSCRNYDRKIIPYDVKNLASKMIVSSGKKSSRKMIMSGGKLLRLYGDKLNESNWPIVVSANNAPFILPDGWIVEEVPRKYHGRDKYYYEPGMGKRFRSLVAVERYLTEMEENAPLSKMLEAIKENKPLSKKSTLVQKDKSGNSTRDSSFVTPPMKVNWVLDSPEGDAWIPFISDTLVPDSVKQHWSDRFNVIMKDGVVDG